MAQATFNVVIHEEDDGSYWSEVRELPGCFASGFSMAEVKEATFEAIQMWLPDGVVLDTPRWSKDRKDSSVKGKKKRPPRRMLVCA